MSVTSTGDASTADGVDRTEHGEDDEAIDPAQAIGSAKEPIESTAKTVLAHLGPGP